MIIFLTGGAIMSSQANFNDIDHLGRSIPVWIMMVIMAILTILLLNLIILHIYLRCRGITTYELLMERKRNDDD